jgi:hypothetical protein
MAESKNTDFTLARNNYTSFDALTLKQLIKQRLNEEGVFTDQVFEGSNISAIIDIIAYSYHTLLFYLNSTASESLFSESTLYENMNRIVKLIDYKPNGYQTSILSFEATANKNLLPNLYTIKRYSYFTINGLYYSFTGDISFNKLTEGDEFLQSLSDNNILHQGQYFELPVQNAIGENFETATIVVKDNITGEPVFIDGNSIDVYVRDTNTGKYNFYNETNNIFLLGPESLSYEKRINENGFYEIKFGNGIFGKRLNEGDEILIYYLKSDGESGVVSPNQLNGNNLNFFTTPQFEAISKDIYATQNITFLTPQNAQNIAFSNQNSSTNPKEKETVDEIRINSKKSFQSQNRLVTIEDYETFITRNFSNIIQSLNVVNNKSYINEYIKYFYDLGLDRPNDDPRFLFNQLKFSSSGESNNVYLFGVPAIKNVNENNEVNFLSTSQKNSIVNAIETQKMVNIEIIPQDPIYTGFNLGLSLPNEKLNLDIINETFLVVKRDVSVRNSAESIKQQVNNIFINFFDNLKIGDLVSISNIINEILTVQGVTEVITRRVTNNITLQSPNLSLLVFNSSYPEIDINTISSDIQLPFFKFPFLYNKSILNNIIVEDA